MLQEFDFCKHSRVIKELAPEEAGTINMGGWDFSAKPVHPYRRSFVVKLHGLRWYVDSAGGYDYTLDSEHNAARLLKFYEKHRLFAPFVLNHETYGRIECRFKSQVNIEPAIGNSGGLIEAFDVTLIHHNPGY
jgi:hypothetical protein